MKKINLYLLKGFVLIVFLSCNGSKENESKTEQLIIFHAGSLSVPFKEMKTAFEKENPNVSVLLEAAGSVQCARKITDLHKECDIIASADYKVIDDMLIPGYTGWNIRFAGNEMTIVYHSDSKYSEEINAINWYDILLRQDVIYGRSDPNSDPCGYRSVFCTQLSEIYYDQEGLSDRILSKDNSYIRPKEVDLIALLESNVLDYIFLYRSVAEQHGLDFVILPDSVNLKDPNLDDLYKTAHTEINGKEPGTKMTVTGQSMVYGISVIQKSKRKELAYLFLEFVLNKEKGLHILEQNGQSIIVPAYSDTYDQIPEQLKQFAKSHKEKK